MLTGILAFGILSGHLLFDILVGLLGSRRNIGFGLAFILSVLFSPIVGLIIVLLSSELPAGSEPKYGCLGHSFGCLGAIALIVITGLVLAALLAVIMPGV